MCQNLSSKCMRHMLVAVTLLLCVTVAFAGCSEETNALTPADPKYAIKAPANINYVVHNQLEIEEVYVDRYGELRDEELPSMREYEEMNAKEQAAWEGQDVYFSGNYLKIDGLKNRTVQEKVNEKIKKFYLDNTNFVPPYRGVKLILGENPQREENAYSYATMYVVGNFNNILSIVMYLDQPYKVEGAEDESIDLSWMATLNINLNTGEDIPLEKDFCDNVDAIAYLNTYIQNWIEDNDSDEEEYRFESIKETQKYAIADYGLILYFDYETPEFYTQYYFEYCIVPTSPEMAILERYFDEDKNIYEDNAPWVKNLIASGVGYDLSLFDSDEKGGIYKEKTVYYSSRLPKLSQERAEVLHNEGCTELIRKPMEENYQKAVAEVGVDKVKAGYRRYVFVDQIGSFINILIDDSGHISVGDLGSYETYYNDRRQQAETYKVTGNKMERLTLDDIFVDKANKEKLLKEAMIARASTTIANAFKPQSEFAQGEYKEKDLEYIDKLYENISGFSIRASYLELVINDAKEIFKSIYGEDENRHFAYYWDSIFLDYKNLGCDNLTIFQ